MRHDRHVARVLFGKGVYCRRIRSWSGIDANATDSLKNKLYEIAHSWTVNVPCSASRLLDHRYNCVEFKNKQRVSISSLLHQLISSGPLCVMPYCLPSQIFRAMLTVSKLQNTKHFGSPHIPTPRSQDKSNSAENNPGPDHHLCHLPTSHCLQIHNGSFL